MGCAVHSASRKPVIGIVDDDFAVRNSLQFALEGEGFLIQSYPSAEHLLSDDVITGVSCFIVDYKLPGLNGLELVKALRRRALPTPVILITTNPPAELRRIAAEEQVVIVEKPLLGETLFQQLRAELGRSSRPKTR